MTIGLNRLSAAPIVDQQHLTQSIADILTTPIGSRVMRRSYGSRLPEMLGRPQNAETRADVVAATAEALARWEPRIVVARVIPQYSASGLTGVTIETEPGELLEVKL